MNAMTNTDMVMEWLGKEIVETVQAKAERLEELTAEEMRTNIEIAYGKLEAFLAGLAKEQANAERCALRLEEFFEQIELGDVMRTAIADHRDRKG